jgi:amino acid adenylation domain-containing protein/FkbM family methyltransferase/non-ribosomal peptide synthase protein (TIGR01720 family)
MNEKYFPFGFDYSEQPASYDVEGIRFSVEGWHNHVDWSDLRLHCQAGPHRVNTCLEFDTGLVEPRMAGILIGCFEQMLRSVSGEPDQCLARLEVLNRFTQRQILELSRGPVAEFSRPECVHQLFEEQVARTPNQTAVVSGPERLTYQQLNNRADSLAVRLRSLGVRSDVLVGVSLDDAINFATAVWGVLKAGGGYVPLDPSLVSARTQYQIADANLKVIVTTRRLCPLLESFAGEKVLLNEGSDTDAIVSYQRAFCDPASLAYVIYTSGSTGQPKGVGITHHSLANYCLSVIGRLKLRQPYKDGLAFATVSTTSADLGNTAIFPCFLSGGCLHMIQHSIATDSERLADYMIANRIDVLKIVPAHLRALLDSPRARQLLPRAHLIIGGEKLTNDLWEQIGSLAPSCTVTNHYGPTEATIGGLTFSPRSEYLWRYKARSVPIGRPLANIAAYVLDQSGSLVPPGGCGELYIGGAGVARGYLGQPGITAESFLPDPFSEVPGSRFYRTGDVVRRLPDGAVEYIERKDLQIKIRGYRVETGEVEAALRKHRAVKDAYVSAGHNRRSEPELVAYVVARPQSSSSPDGSVELQNGLSIYQTNGYETEFFAGQIFGDCTLGSSIRIDDNDTVFDVGANIGLFALYAHGRAKNVRVFAFEPIPDIFDILRKNLHLHQVRAELFQCGLSEGKESGVFTYYPLETCMSGCHADLEYDRKTLLTILKNRIGENADRSVLNNLVNQRVESRTVECPMTTISDVIRLYNVDRVDLLKIDTEKSEVDVLRGIQEVDWPKIRQIVIEAHRDCGGLTQALALLEKHGYQYLVEQDPLLRETDIFSIFAIQSGGGQLRRGSPTSGNVGDKQAGIQSRGVSAKELREYVQQQLPDYMVPSSIILLDSLPLTPNGKLDRDALPPPEAVPDEAFEPPRTLPEFKMAVIWTELLGVERVSRTSNFFELGGDSIIGIQLVARANQVGFHLEPRHLFEYPTLEKLASSSSTPSVAVEPAPATGPVPLTPVQCWFFDQALPQPGLCCQAVLLMVPKQGTAPALELALQAVYDHHDALRLRFQWEKGEWKALNNGPERLAFTRFDLKSLPVDQQKHAIEAISAEIQTTLNIQHGPLLRSAYFDLDSHCGRLLIVAHHLVIDAVSWRILIEDLQWSFQQSLAGSKVRDLTKTTSFQSWAKWLLEQAQSDAVEREAEYWLGLNASGKRLPVESQPALNAAKSSRVVARSLETEDTMKLVHEAPRRHSAQINDLLLGALVQTLGWWSGQRELIVWLEAHGREMPAHLEISRTVGWFTSIFPLLVPLADSLSSQVNIVSQRLKAVPRHGLGYGLLRYLHPERTLRDRMKNLAEPEVLFNYLGRMDSAFSQPGRFGWSLESASSAAYARGAQSYPLEFRAWVLEGKFWLEVEHSRNVYSPSTVDAIADRYITDLRALVAAEASESINTEDSGLSDDDLEHLLGSLSQQKRNSR